MAIKMQGRKATQELSKLRNDDLCGVILVNTGTPASPDPRAVRKYLAQFLMDRRIVPMNRILWWFILHLFILPKRACASAEKYKAIWTKDGSFFINTHEKLTRALNEAYAQKNEAVVVRYAMNYGAPSIASVISELANAGCTRLVILPLYPQSAYSTAASVSDSVERAIKKTHWVKPYVVCDDYHDDVFYIKAIAASITHAGFDVSSNDRILFSYHSIPLTDIEAGDTYELQTDATSLQVASELGIDRKRWTIGYQCRFDKKREWLSPFTKEILSRWASAGTGHVFFVCPNFSVDCLETLYDVKRELEPFYFEERNRAGMDLDKNDFVYVPCLNSTRAHVKVLMHVLNPYL